MSWIHGRTKLMVCVALAMLAGCASVPMASEEEDAAAKTFAPPPVGKAGVYVFRNSFSGQALAKSVYIDGVLIGETANKVYFYRLVDPGPHTLSTESEFSNNDLKWDAVAGENYFFRQYIKWGVFVGGANLELVDADEGKAEVAKCKLAAGTAGGAP